jgi:hypothetical protein
MTRKRYSSIILAITLIVLAVAVGITRASTGTTASGSDPFTVVIPTGPKLPVEKLLSIARAEASAAGETNPQISVGEGTFEAARRTIASGNVAPETQDPGLRSQLERPVYLVVMTGHFSLGDAPVPPRSGTPTGSVFDLIVDSHTGEIVGRALPAPQEAATTEALATTASNYFITVHRLSGVDLSPPFQMYGEITGTLTGRRAEVILFRGKRVFDRVTPEHGKFRIALVLAGTYGIAGRLPSGHYCKGKKVIVEKERRTTVALTCPKVKH